MVSKQEYTKQKMRAEHMNQHEPVTNCGSLFLSAAVILLLLTGCTTTQAPLGNESAISFQFDWPKRLAAKLDISSSRYSERGGVDTALRAEASWRLMAEDLANGNRKITHSLIGQPTLTAGAQAKPVIALQALFQIGAPTLTVSSAGEFLRASDFDGLSKNLLSVVEELAHLPGGMGDLFEQIFSKENYASAALLNWEAMVSSWIPRTYEPEALYAYETESALPIPGNPLLNYKSEISISKPGPCPGSPAKQCVATRTVTIPNREELMQILSDLNTKLSQAAGVRQRVIFGEYNLVTTTSLVTEPDTLVPHRMEIVKEITTRIDQRDGKRGKPFTEKQQQIWVFSY